jgi:hypothetical protein
MDFFQDFSLLIRDSILIAAISRKFTGLLNINAAFRQTKVAFEIGKKKILRFDF